MVPHHWFTMKRLDMVIASALDTLSSETKPITPTTILFMKCLSTICILCIFFMFSVFVFFFFFFFFFFGGGGGAECCFFINFIFKNIFQVYHQSVNGFGSRLSPICVQTVCKSSTHIQTWLPACNE